MSTVSETEGASEPWVPVLTVCLTQGLTISPSSWTWPRTKTWKLHLGIRNTQRAFPLWTHKAFIAPETMVPLHLGERWPFPGHSYLASVRVKDHALQDDIASGPAYPAGVSVGHGDD